jgi:Lon protease-like protein
VARVRIREEIPTDRLYRTARVEAVAETAPSPHENLKALRKNLADVVLPRFDDDPPAGRQLRELFDGEMTLGQLCDVLAYALPLPLELKQAMLAEADVSVRAVSIADAFRAAAARAGRKFPPEFSHN